MASGGRVLQDTGVAFLPGSVLGRRQGDLSVQRARVDIHGAAALAGLSECGRRGTPDDAWLERYCTPAFEGVERLCRWLEDATPG